MEKKGGAGTLKLLRCTLWLTATPRLVPCPWQLSQEPNSTVNINSTNSGIPKPRCVYPGYTDARRNQISMSHTAMYQQNNADFLHVNLYIFPQTPCSIFAVSAGSWEGEGCDDSLPE